MSRLSSSARRLLSGAACVAALAPITARAARRCTVRLTRGDPAWRAAADRLQARLSAPGADGDCEAVDIRVRENGARLVFTTRDGRRAVRQLAAPSELEPTVEMLSVTGPPPPPKPRQTPEPDRAAPVRPAAPSARQERLRVLYGAGVGARGGANTLLSPVLRAFGSMGLGHWEIGVLGQWEMRYTQVVDQPAGVQPAWGLAGGVTATRRQPLGSVVSLIAGADLVLAALDEESSEHSDTEGRAEARVGAFVGAVLPRSAAVRWRATLGADFSPTHFGKSPTTIDGAPLLPWWALTLTAGVEFGGP